MVFVVFSTLKAFSFFFTNPPVTVKILYLMGFKVKIDGERCKGCGLCVTVCPNKGLAVSKTSNKKGFFPAEIISFECSGCISCALICPEAAIDVYHIDNIRDVKAQNKPKQKAVTEKT